ncbi:MULTISPECIES: PHP domain-containing protein [Metasolibacillus]|uniref:PHP domain-containing protein n=1 Tax=Metasolibacillus TaxID=2703677 RepID=UPI00079C7905|nr:PHP domain-containing protein [Metasolibacillus fluoroglycofenilyticus]KYG89732.1 phosphatase [[Bacillus] sp. KCTC 13219]
MKVDLHMHSTYSDGSNTLEELFRQAKTVGLTHISVVDHDTVHHFEEGQQLAEKYNIHFIPGIEISAYDFERGRKVHMLGYQLQGSCEHIRQLCQPLLNRRHEHTLWQMHQIQEAGFAITEEQAYERIAKVNVLYKQHIMDVLTTASFDSKDYQTLYRSLFKNNGVAASDIRYVDVFAALRAIKADGGIAVLAHPGQLDSYEIAEELIKEGLDGIELVHPDHNEQDYERIVTMANKHGLLMTGGSDYHGRYGTEIALGKYTMQHLYMPQFVNA